jgi:hypothetical protein
VYVVPPMDDQPPGDFVTFVAVHLGDLQREAAQLTGGDRFAGEIYPDALADVAGHWRRLRLRHRLTRRDEAGRYLSQRLATRAKQWRDDQVYDVDVQLIRTPVRSMAPGASIALRKATLLEDTVRIPLRPVAEAAIAWEHAVRRARWHALGRAAAIFLLVFVGLIQALPAVSS